MADEENEGEETSSRGHDWEVVSLTASTYGAAPGPKGSDSTDDDKDKVSAPDPEESSSAMFMSGHFVFPPSQHENLPLEPDNSEILNEPGSEGVDSTQEGGLGVGEGDRLDKASEENWNIKGLSEADELHGIQFFDGKGKSFSGHSTEYEEVRALEELNLIKEEQSIYSTSKFGSFHAEADLSGSIASAETNIIPDPDDPSHPNLGSPSDISKPQKAIKEDKDNESGLPCEAWWKRRAAALYSHAKEANTIWSVVVAATLMGLVILGQRWQQERWQMQQLKWKFGITDEF
ncbi:ATG8-interacting protein 2 isoform X2 [Magnolia sinica]|uniref:ATG8-interacting protein 2 isoform X2 n=1 Tax=Magnolia sinica TaxID=86752 RepID=UPI0026587D16|nr:ATG8-interacting protein 2 isoform X2 [Magnolia sinica]